MKSLYLYQFACLIFMLLNAFVIAITTLHVRWENKRYEQSRWMIFAALMGMAAQYFIQMTFGYRATGDNQGAVINILVYTPCFSLISMAIFNIETTCANRKLMNIVCVGIYALMAATFAFASGFFSTLHIGIWLYVMLAMFCASVVFCTFMIVREMTKRKKMLEEMTATDMLPYVRYSHASLLILLCASLVMPFAVLSTTLLYIIGPVALLALLFFNLTFVALGTNYIPTESLLYKDYQQEQKEENASGTSADTDIEHADIPTPNGRKNCMQQQHMTEERMFQIQRKLDQWCGEFGYKDNNANMLTLSRTISVSKDELSQFFDQCMHSTFRIWLSDIRFNAAKKMMLQYPDYSNDIISAECGFSSRTHLYRIFKSREQLTPTAWRELQMSKA